jgi:hypothetical protein
MFKLLAIFQGILFSALVIGLCCVIPSPSQGDYSTAYDEDIGCISLIQMGEETYNDLLDEAYVYGNDIIDIEFTSAGKCINFIKVYTNINIAYIPDYYNNTTVIVELYCDDVLDETLEYDLKYNNEALDMVIYSYDEQGIVILKDHEYMFHIEFILNIPSIGAWDTQVYNSDGSELQRTLFFGNNQFVIFFYDSLNDYYILKLYNYTWSGTQLLYTLLDELLILDDDYGFSGGQGLDMAKWDDDTFFIAYVDQSEAGNDVVYAKRYDITDYAFSLISEKTIVSTTSINHEFIWITVDTSGGIMVYSKYYASGAEKQAYWYWNVITTGLSGPFDALARGDDNFMVFGADNNYQLQVYGNTSGYGYMVKAGTYAPSYGTADYLCDSGTGRNMSATKYDTDTFIVIIEDHIFNIERTLKEVAINEWSGHGLTFEGQIQISIYGTSVYILQENKITHIEIDGTSFDYVKDIYVSTNCYEVTNFHVRGMSGISEEIFMINHEGLSKSGRDYSETTIGHEAIVYAYNDYYMPPIPDPDIPGADDIDIASTLGQATCLLVFFLPAMVMGAMFKCYGVASGIGLMAIIYGMISEFYIVMFMGILATVILFMGAYHHD